VILAVLGSFAPFSIDMYLAAFPAMARDLGTGIERIQLTLSVFFFGLAAGQLLYGPWSDCRGRKAPLYCGLALYILVTAAMVAVRDFRAFLILRFLQAVGGCSGMIIGRAAVRDSYDLAGATKVFTVLMAVQAVGPVVAPVLGAYITAVSGWPSTFVFMTCLGAACLAVARAWLPETLPEERRIRIGFGASLLSFGNVLGRPGFLWPALAGAFGGSSIFAFISGSPSLLMGRYGFNETEYSWAFAAFSLILALCSQANHALLRRFSQRAILRGALMYMCAASLAVTAASQLAGLPPTWLLLASVLLCLIPVPIVTANSTAIAMNDCGSFAGSASSLLGVLQFSAGGFVSLAVSAAADLAVLPMATVILLASLAGLACLLAGARLSGPGAGGGSHAGA
jgi:DHA1 family bicyclomycin/chloramphenicol resistance-like MFS transporter